MIDSTTRVEAGFYEVRLDGGEVYEVVNMQGQAVRYMGVGPYWHVRVPVLVMAGGQRVVHEAYTKREAMAWLADR